MESILTYFETDGVIQTNVNAPLENNSQNEFHKKWKIHFVILLVTIWYFKCRMMMTIDIVVFAFFTFFNSQENDSFNGFLVNGLFVFILFLHLRHYYYSASVVDLLFKLLQCFEYFNVLKSFCSTNLVDEQKQCEDRTSMYVLAKLKTCRFTSLSQAISFTFDIFPYLHLSLALHAHANRAKSCKRPNAEQQ